MGVGEKFVTKAQFEEWYRSLDRRINELKTLQGGSGGGGGVPGSFISLTDTPSSFSGSWGKPVLVNDGENGLQFGGHIRLDVDYEGVSSPPTASELAAIFGSAADGFTALVQDTDGSLWLCVKSNGAWWYVQFSQAS
jgi:hypothetical protein